MKDDQSDDPFQDDFEAPTQPLEEDNDTPFSEPASPVSDANLDTAARNDELDPTHPATDAATNIDSHELYDEGMSGATEASEPNANDAVVNYTPPNTQEE